MTDQKVFKNKCFFSISFVLGFFFFGCSEEDALTAALEISESPLYDFGSVTTSSSVDHTFTITNSGVVIATNIEGLELDAPFSYKGGVFPGTGGTCGVSLDVDATCEVILSFEPTATVTSEDTLYIRYNNGTVNRILELDLTGEGSSGGGGGSTALLVISDGPVYDFGNVNTGNTSSHSFTVTNTGTATATALSGTGLAAPFSFNGGVYPGTGGTCAVTLAAAASCTIVVQFAPVIVGVSSDTINLDYNDGTSAQTATRDVQGTGL